MLPAFRHSLRRAILIAGLLLTTAAQAHVVKQIFAKFTAGPDKWQAEVTMDAGYAWPEFRDDPNSPQPTVEWLESLPPASFARLRRESETVLRQHLDFRRGTTSLAWTCRFPDFDRFPPDFPEITGGGAFLTVRIEGLLPPPGSSLTVKELTGQLPDFVFQTGEEQFPTLEPGKVITLFQTPETAKGPATVQGFWSGFTHTVLTGWDFALFIVALVLPDRRWRTVLLQFLCYVAGTTAALWLVGSGVVHLSPAVLRPLAGLSLAAIAAHNLLSSQRRHQRLTIVFGLSLLQGLALTGPLIGAAPAKDLTSLLLANISLECDAACILLASALSVHFLSRKSWRDRASRDLNLLLLLTGLALSIQRVFY